MSSRQPVELDDEEQYVDVRALPLRPPQPAPPPGKAARRPWHPVMWDDTIVGLPPPDHKLTAAAAQDESLAQRAEYPHKQRLRNLRRLIAAGKVQPTPETLIYFLCNKFAVSDERKAKVEVEA